MIKVTDPEILAQLEADNEPRQYSNGMQKVTDPNILAQLEGQQQPIKEGILKRYLINPSLAIGDAGLNAALGAGDAFTNALTFGYGGDAAKKMGYADPESISYNLGRIGGHIGAAAIPGSLAAKAIRGGMLGARAIPYANTLGSMLGGAEEGFAANPGERASSAIEGAAIPLAFKGISKGLKIGKNVGKALINRNPALYEQELVKRGGEDFLKQIEKPSSDLYNAIEEATAGKGMSFRGPTLEKLTNISPQAERLYKDPDIKPLYESFLTNRGYIQAKNLRSALGDEARDLLKTKAIKGSLNTAQKQKLKTIYDERRTLNNFIDEHLETFPGLKESFQKANLLHRKDVIPARNAAKTINDYVNDITGDIRNKKELINTLSNSYTKNAIGKKPMPRELFDILNKYEQNLNNKENLSHLMKQMFIYGFPATIGGTYLGHHINKYLTGVNKT